MVVPAALRRRPDHAASPGNGSGKGKGAGRTSDASEGANDDQDELTEDEKLAKAANLPILTQFELVGVVFLLIILALVAFPFYQLYKNMPDNWRELK